jgi:hypothetical protein
LDLAFRLVNVSGSDVSLDTPSETVGTVQLLIAGQGDFRTYLGPGWGTEDSVRTPGTLKKDSSIDMSLRVLYQVQRGQPYTFPAAGTFRLKVTYQDSSVCSAATTTPVLTVQVTQPTGDDLSVWNAIKDCKQCAYFLHTAHAGKSAVYQNALALLRSLVVQYPSSRYAKLIRQQLAAFDERSRPRPKDKDKSQGDD